MKWKRIPKENSVQPKKGTYHDWKGILAQEGSFQCVYCAIHENSFGGIRNFHVEHYRPKSTFRSLEHDITNLFYACAICNTFKGDDWPGDPLPDFSNPAYPDPAKIDYNDLFINATNVSVLEGKFIASKYLIEKLYLNRPQLIVARRWSASISKLQGVHQFAKSLTAALISCKKSEANGYLGRLIKVLIKISELQSAIHELRPYDTEDIKKPSVKKTLRSE